MAWRMTKHATLFRLTNKAVQLIFKDNSEIVLISSEKRVLYCSKRGERRNLQLKEAMSDPDTELSNRLTYAKDIVQNLMQEDSKVQY